MADSTYLKQIVEPYVVSWISQHIKIPLTRRRLAVGPRLDGTPVHFEFDGASEDGKIALLVSTSLTLKPGAIHKLHSDASILLHTPLQRRLMVFISEDTRLNFLNKCDGLLPLNKIEMLVCPLPSKMASEVAKFQFKAKREVGDRGRKMKVGRKRR